MSLRAERRPRTPGTIVALVAAGGAITSVSVASRHVSTPAAIVGWVGLTAWLAIFAAGWWRRHTGAEREWRLFELAALAAAVVVMAVSLSFQTVLIWMPFLLMLQAARSLAPLPAVAVSSAPVACLGAMSWHEGHHLGSVAANMLIAVVVLGFILQRRRRREFDELAAAQRAAIEREQARASAAELQREVGARLHDVLAHTLSGLVVSLTTASLQAQAEGASLQLQQRLDASRDLARSGLIEARRAVESLRSPAVLGAAVIGAGVAPPEAIDLPAWFAETVHRLERGAALDVRLEGDLATIPAHLAPLARSVLMESLTNSLRHSPGSPVRIGVEPAALSVLSARTDDEPPTPGEHPSGQHGIEGLRARAEAAGGRLTAGPAPQGWTVRWEWSR